MALVAVCIFWGTTYLGIRIALESFPPAVLICVRFLLSGALLLAASIAGKRHIPAGRELWMTALFGLIVLGLGNGGLVFAEQWVPSGLAAVFITLSPFWMLAIEAALPGGERLHGPTLLAMLVGLCGTLLLVGPGAVTGGWQGPVMKGFVVLQLGSCAWSFGSLLQKRYESKAHPIVSGAIQQFATGLVFLVPAMLQKEPIHWNVRGVSAVLYLVTFGSIVGYSAYVYSLQHLPVSVVSVYNYVNPVVAVLLGFAVLGERFGMREIVAMAIIFAGVALVKRVQRPAPAK